MRAEYPVQTFDRSTPEPAEKERRKTRVLTPTFRQLPLSQLLFRGMSYPASLRTCGRYEFLFEHPLDTHQNCHPQMAALIRIQLLKGLSMQNRLFPIPDLCFYGETAILLSF